MVRKDRFPRRDVSPESVSEKLFYQALLLRNCLTRLGSGKTLASYRFRFRFSFGFRFRFSSDLVSNSGSGSGSGSCSGSLLITVELSA